MGAPTGTVTFFFTDIEGSTRLWEGAPESMRAALARHDAIVRGAIEDNGGYLFSTGGDGFSAAFGRAGDAARAAARAQDALAGEVWPEAAPIRVRIGMHTGEAEERGGDYFGPAVNRAARVMALGHGGQTLCTSATAELVSDVELVAVDLGEHRLRDLSAAQRVWQLGEGTFPQLRSLDVLPGNLPLLVSSFIGREAELARVAEAIGAERLVTLTGVGGVGKTRLALHVAGDVTPRFPDGAWLCELAAASTADELAQVVAVALGVVLRPQMTLVESIVDFLRARELLIVLDNCEHLLDPTAELVATLLERAPGVRVLATSREALGVDGEHVLPVRPLPVVGAAGAASGAVLLFVSRARAADPDFRLDDENRPAVDEVCQRLDGIPLAIELAAARVATMTPVEIAGHLDERFRLLSGGKRRGVERHQTLRSAVEWSYSLLGRTAQAVFDRLGVFPASFDEAAAVAVCGDEHTGRWEVIDALADLAAKSLVGAEHSHGATRYQLLETLRHFARDCLAERGELEERRRRHADHYAGFAADAGAGLVSPDELAWVPRLGAELDNLRAAVAWAFDADAVDDVRVGVRILDALLLFLVQGRELAIESWAAAAIPRVEELERSDRAVVLACTGAHLWYEGDIGTTLLLGRRVLAENDGLTPAVMHALVSLAMALLPTAPDEAMAVIAEGHRRFEAQRQGADWQVALLSIVEAWVTHFNDDAAGRSAAARALAAARRMGWPAALAGALAISARLILEEDPNEALAQAEESLGLLAAGAAAGSAEGSVAQTAAIVLFDRGNRAAAASTLAGAIARLADGGDHLAMAPTVIVAAIVLGGSRGTEHAAATLAGALRVPEFGYPYLGAALEARYDGVLAVVRARLGDDQFDRAVERGVTMSYDDIVAHTIDHLRSIAGSTAP
jgi:predicted ATPase/class 3 adenylate cyclase